MLLSLLDPLTKFSNFRQRLLGGMIGFVVGIGGALLAARFSFSCLPLLEHHLAGLDAQPAPVQFGLVQEQGFLDRFGRLKQHSAIAFATVAILKGGEGNFNDGTTILEQSADIFLLGIVVHPKYSDPERLLEFFATALSVIAKFSLVVGAPISLLGQGCSTNFLVVAVWAATLGVEQLAAFSFLLPIDAVLLGSGLCLFGIAVVTIVLLCWIHIMGEWAGVAFGAFALFLEGEAFLLLIAFGFGQRGEVLWLVDACTLPNVLEFAIITVGASFHGPQMTDVFVALVATFG